MKPTPLLDFWQKPAGAGAPVALLATTFALEPDFFEQNCLARFLEVSSVNEGTGAIDDIVAAVELHESLQNASVTVLADRSAPVQRSSLLWDLLSCKVRGNGLLHAKVVVLLWEKATRVIIGSANLTSAGYRRQIELGLAADLGPGCLFPPDVLRSLAEELHSYLRLVPGYDRRAAIFARATSTLELLGKRINEQTSGPTTIRVALAPTNPNSAPLDALEKVWRGAMPLRATHLSPFWDSSDQSVLAATRRLLTGRPAEKRSQRVAVVLSPRGQTPFSPHLAARVDAVRRLKDVDSEIRTLHAKCLLIESDEWVAALVGSSNHTLAGLGLGGPNRRHQEINVWIGAPRGSKEGGALLDLVVLGEKIPTDAEVVEPQDEDEAVLPALPACFGLCQVMKNVPDGPWQLHLGIARMHDMPDNWQIGLSPESLPFLTRAQWTGSGEPESVAIDLPPQMLPLFVVVAWDDSSAPWAVVADNRHALPLGPTLSSLRADHLLDALAKGRPLAQVLREELERQQATAAAQGAIVLDPLKRLEIQGSLLRKGRALAASLASMQRRLERPVVTLDALRGRLASPLGPEFVAVKVAEAVGDGRQSRAEAVFTIAEIALAIGRIAWSVVLAQVDRSQGALLVDDVLVRLDALQAQIGLQPSDLASYASRAVEEARKCVPR